MSYTTYIIQNTLNVVYVGMSTDFTRRLKQHRAGYSPSTNKGCLDWKPHHTWVMPSFLYMSKLERCLHKLALPNKVKEFATKYPVFCKDMQSILDMIPPSQCDHEPDWSIKKHFKRPQAPRVFSTGKGNTKAQRKAKQPYHNGVKKQRADRAIIMKDEFAKFTLDPETVRKLAALEKDAKP